MIDASGDAARRLRASRRRGEAGGRDRVRIVDDSPSCGGPTAGSVVTIGVYDGVHLGHHAVLRLVRKLADARGARRRVRHLRPPPRRGRAPRVGAEAAHHTEQKLELLDAYRLPRPLLRAALRRGPQPRAGRGLRAARCSSTGARRAPRGRRRRLPLRARPRRQRAAARADGRRARVRGGRASASRQGGDGAIYSSTADPRAAPGGRRRRRGRRCSAARTRSGGRSMWATGADASSGFPTANLMVPARICLPADGIYAGTFVGRRRRRAARRDLARAAPDLLRERRDVACWRPTCSTSTATSTATRPRSASSSGSGARSASRRVEALVEQMQRDVEATRRLLG